MDLIIKDIRRFKSNVILWQLCHSDKNHYILDKLPIHIYLFPSKKRKIFTNPYMSDDPPPPQ